jgi:hypothetical protein
MPIKFIDVDPDSIPNLREGRRGRVSYPIMKSFLESGKALVQLDRSELKRTAVSLVASLGMYAKNKGLPVKVFMRNGEIYFLRTDATDKTTAPVLDIDEVTGREAEIEDTDDTEIEEITPAMVMGRTR